LIPIVYGPTAVGKTEIMVKVCERLGCEIISMDSRQIYRYMDIGTAKPSEEERKRIHHHMIDILDPDEYYNAYMYRKDSLKVMEEIKRRGKIPVYVGGTGLYADALVRGIFEGVPADENIRRELKKLHEQEPGILRKMLEDFDPEAARKIHPNDLKRTIRALEVYMKTGKKISELQREAKPAGRFEIIVLWRERKELYDRINSRVEKMLEMGLVDEVKKLLKIGYTKDLNSMKTIGYRETIEYLEGKYDFQHYVHVLKRNTRHFARRQIIWSKRYEDAVKINLTFEENPVEKVMKIMEEILKQ
jgi:tRNA dimethylallyltransferase